MNSVAEIWRPIPGFDGYWASSLGRVKSTRRKTPRILKPIPHRGYVVVKLGDPNKAFGVHQVVARAFHGEPDDGEVVNHINGNKTDNRPENLEYTSNSGNVHHAYRTGLLSNKGETNGRAKINAETARSIAACRGMKRKDIARRFGVSVVIVNKILTGKTWRHAL